jgi:lipoprotein NlpI
MPDRRRWVGLFAFLLWIGLTPSPSSSIEAAPMYQLDPNIAVQITSPRAGERVQGAIEITGYAADVRSEVGSGLNERDIQIYLRGSQITETLVGYAGAGEPSPQAVTVLGQQFNRVGFSRLWDSCGQPPGSYEIVVWVSSLITSGARNLTSVDVEVVPCSIEVAQPPSVPTVPQAASTPAVASNPTTVPAMPDPRAIEAYQRGTQLGNGKDYQAALTAFNTAISIDPTYAEAYRNRGVARYYLRDFAGALEDLTTALRLNPNDPLALSRRSYLRAEMNDLQGALEDIEQTLRLDPQDSVSLANRGWLHYRLGDRQAALNDSDEAIRMNPNNAIAYNTRGVIRYDRGEYAAAVDECTRAIQSNSTYGHPYFTRAGARFAQGDRQGALADLQTAARLFSESGDTTYYERAMTAIRALQQ